MYYTGMAYCNSDDETMSNGTSRKYIHRVNTWNDC